MFGPKLEQLDDDHIGKRCGFARRIRSNDCADEIGDGGRVKRRRGV